jgi:hypothetical protein
MSDKILKPAAVIGRTHAPTAESDHVTYGKPSLGRDPRRGKIISDLPIHGGMNRQTKSGVVAFGGDHASALDSLSGKSVVPAKLGGAVAADPHPLTTPPTAKNYAPVKPVPGMRSRNGEVDVLKPGVAHVLGVGRGVDHGIGKLIMDEAVANSGVGDHTAHPYTRGGSAANVKFNAQTPARNPAARATAGQIVASTKTN